MYIIEQITEINPFGRRIRCADPNVKPDAKSRNNNIGGNGKIYFFFFFIDTLSSESLATSPDINIIVKSYEF